MKFDNIKKEKMKWIVYRLIYSICAYCVIIFLNYITKTFHPINLAIVFGIILIVFFVLYNQDNKIFNGLEEFNKQKYEYVLKNKKEIIRYNAVSLEKLGALAVLISAYKLKDDECFLELLEKTKIRSNKMLDVKVVILYYYFMYCIEKNDLLRADELFNKIQVLLASELINKNQVLSFNLYNLQRLVELLNKFYKGAILDSERVELMDSIEEERMKNIIAVL